MIRFCTTATEFQDALNVCVAGDVISLDHTKTFEGAFILKNRGVIPEGQEIVIESDADKSLLPTVGYRIKPTYSALLPKIRPPQVQNRRLEAAMATAAGANGYILRFLEVLPHFWGSSEQISLGFADNRQTEYSQQPYNIWVDRCYIYGDRLRGGKRGVGFHGKNIFIINCYMDHHVGVGQDTQNVLGANGEGPITIINNHLCGGSYSFMTGGSDVPTRTAATVLASPAPTSTEATVSTLKDLSVGQMVAILYTDGAGVVRRKQPYVTAINTTTNRITFPDIGVIPDVPGDIRWGLQMRNITFRRNLVTKRPEWQFPWIATPVVAAPIVTGAAAGLAAGTYYFRVQAIAVQSGYENVDLLSTASVEQSAAVAATSTIKLSWPSVPDATTYRIYRYQRDPVTSAIINGRYFSTTALDFTDIGGAGTTFTSVSGGIRPVIKNWWELKTGTDVQNDSNIYEYHWKGADAGGSIWLKNNNQSGNHEFSQCSRIVMEKNLFRHSAGWMQCSGMRSFSNAAYDNPEPMRDILFRNNLIIDSTAQWCEGGNIYGTAISNGVEDITFDHNTILHQVYGMLSVQKNTKTGPGKDYLFTNNIMIRLTYGMFNAGIGTEGKATLDYVTNNENFCDKNVFANCSASLYNWPGATNFFPSHTTLHNQFKNWSNGVDGDYRLKRISEGDDIDSLYINAGTDGKDVGCDINLLMAAIAGVEEGLPEGAPPIDPEEPPEPPIQSTSNLDRRMISFDSADVVGPQVIDIGFQPKVLVFYYSTQDVDGEDPDYSFGIGAWALGSQWSGFTKVLDAQASSKPSANQRTDSCIVMSGNTGIVARQASVSSVGATGFTLDWTVVNPTKHVINVLCLGGEAITEAICTQMNLKPTTGSQVNPLAFSPDFAMFYAPINQSNPLPYGGGKNTSMWLGLATSTDEGYVTNRFPLNSATNLSKRKFSSTKAGGYIMDATQAVEFDVTSFVDGITLNYTTANGGSDIFNVLAIKGPRFDLSLITEPGANGNETYSCGFKPEAIIAAGALNTAGSGLTANARILFGGASADGGQASVASGARDNTTPSIAKSFLDRTKLIHGHVEGGADEASANVSAYTATGYTFTWSGTPSGREVLTLAIGPRAAEPALFESTTTITLGFSSILESDNIMSSTMNFTTQFISPLVVLTAIHHSMIEFFNLRINLDVKREMDSGEVECLAADVDGTPVLFNKAYKDIDSLTLTVKGTIPRTAIYDFVDAPNPTGFKILVFNAAGARVDATVSWKSRGIV